MHDFPWTAVILFSILLPLTILGFLVKTKLTLENSRRIPYLLSLFLLAASLLLLSNILPIRFEWIGFISFPLVITSSFFSLKEYNNNPLFSFFLMVSNFILILRYPTFLSGYIAVAILFLFATLLRLVATQKEFSRSKSYLFSKLAVVTQLAVLVLFLTGGFVSIGSSVIFDFSWFLATLLGTLGAMKEYGNNRLFFRLLCIFSIPLYAYIPFIFLFSTM